MSRLLLRLIAPLLFSWSIAPTLASAQDAPVVVELFTSQGCSSCPPADELMHDLAQRDDVIALALHVDYWDYIGWKDAFAHPAHSERQRRYAVTAGRRSVYTPQMIVNGDTSIVGARAMDLADAIQDEKAKSPRVDLDVSREGDRVSITAQNLSADGPMVVHLLRYQPSRKVKILRGENAGRHMTYSNVVEGWQVLTEWSGREDLRTEATVAGDMPLVVLVQAAGHGPILAAADLR